MRPFNDICQRHLQGASKRGLLRAWPYRPYARPACLPACVPNSILAVVLLRGMAVATASPASSACLLEFVVLHTGILPADGPPVTRGPHKAQGMPPRQQH